MGLGYPPRPDPSAPVLALSPRLLLVELHVRRSWWRRGLPVHPQLVQVAPLDRCRYRYRAPRPADSRPVERPSWTDPVVERRIEDRTDKRSGSGAGGGSDRPVLRLTDATSAT